MAIDFTTNIGKIKYSDPDPFVLPTLHAVPQFPSAHWWQSSGPVSLVPHETLKYDASILEEIMISINSEYAKRKMTKPTWKKYKSSSDDFDTITPSSNGSNLQKVSVKYFPQYVRDIQDAIDGLFTSDIIPDSRSAYLARIFCNNTNINASVFNNNTKLKDDITIIGQEDTYNALTRAQNGEWPFFDSYFSIFSSVRGIGFGKEKHPNIRFNKGQGSIEAYTDLWPQSQIGLTTPSGIGGIDVPMTSANRPIVSNGPLTKDTSIGAGIGSRDYDQGYANLSHSPLVIHQLRWQPPDIEFWPNDIPSRDYVSNVYSNTTPNKAWYFGQPVEKQWQQNWGFWLLKGYVGVSNNRLLLRIYQNPMADTATEAVCPYGILYPPPVAHCHCLDTETAYAIWGMSGLSWNDMELFNSDKAKAKKFGPNTKLKMKYSSSAGEGAGDTVTTRLMVGVRTGRVADMNQQPFTYIYTNENITSGEIEVNIQDAMHSEWGGEYQVGGLDSIYAVIIQLDSTVRSDWDCDAEPFVIPGRGRGEEFSGMKLPDDCDTRKSCYIPDTSVFINWIKIEDDTIIGDPVEDYR